jgi:hypothetical protein
MLPELKNALLARINSIPIVQTLELEIVRFDAQEQLVAVAQVNYILLNHQPATDPDAAHR